MTREELLAQTDDVIIEPIDVPEWRAKLHVRTITGSQREKFEVAYVNDTTDRTEARMASFCLCDEQGVRIFKDEDIDALDRKHPGGLRRIYNAGMRLSKVSEDEIKGEVKNS
jgi:hypothetical protein